MAAPPPVRWCRFPFGGNGNAGATTASNAPKLSVQEREELRKVGGDELVSDTDLANATPGGDGWNIQACVSDYAKGMLEEASRTGLRIGDFKDCNTMCGIAARGSYATMANKYQAKCKDQLNANMGEQNLKDARVALDNPRQSGCPVGWYRNRVTARSASMVRARRSDRIRRGCAR